MQLLNELTPQSPASCKMFSRSVFLVVVFVVLGVVGSLICIIARQHEIEYHSSSQDSYTAKVQRQDTVLHVRRLKAQEAIRIGGKSSLLYPASVTKKIQKPMRKPVQVFILMGQSNMLGEGVVKGGWEGTLESAIKRGKYPFLVDDDGNWSVIHQNVRNMKVTDYYLHKNDEMLTVSDTKKIGPEIGIGKILGDYFDDDVPILLLKSCRGNRSLGWDLLPPGSRSFKFQGRHYAGYKESPPSWDFKEAKPEPIPWYAGKQYDSDVGSAKAILDNLDQYYPGANNNAYEIAGFIFWQGDKDGSSDALTSRYERNLKNFIKSVRKDFEAPNAKFVLATLAQVEKGATGNEGTILDAQLAVDGASGKYEEFRNNVKTVYAHPYWHGGTAHMHYQGRAETFMDVGLALGEAMKELLKTK